MRQVQGKIDNLKTLIITLIILYFDEIKTKKNSKWKSALNGRNLKISQEIRYEKMSVGKESKIKYLPFSAEPQMLEKTGSQNPSQRMGVQEKKNKGVEGIVHG